MTRIEVDSSKCTGCMACILACSFTKTEAFSYEKAVMKILKDEAIAKGELYLCSNCDDMKCIEACPFDAMHYDERWGIPIIDYDKCTSCGICVKACNYSIIRVKDDGRTVYKCDFCNGDPACVKSCIAGAIKLKTLDKKEEEKNECISK